MKSLWLDTRLPPRFWAKVQRNRKGCWLWTADTIATGYAYYHTNGKKVRAHRLAYETLIGLIPVGLVTDHLCKTRNCVNPMHIEPVTQTENLKRSGVWELNKSKTHCPQGHPYNEANTYNAASGSRQCRACTRIKRRKARAAQALQSGRRIIQRRRLPEWA